MCKGWKEKSRREALRAVVISEEQKAGSNECGRELDKKY